MQVDDLLYCGCHSLAAIDNLSIFHSLPNCRYQDVLQVANTHDGIARMQIFQQLTMRCRKHNTMLYGDIYYRSVGQILYTSRIGSVHQDVGMQHLTCPPWIFQGNDRIVFIPDSCDLRSICKANGIAITAWSVDFPTAAR